MKVTEVPVQIAPEGTAAMVTLAGRTELTTIVMVLEVAGEPVRQGAALEVISTEIASPLSGI